MRVFSLRRLTIALTAKTPTRIVRKTNIWKCYLEGESATIDSKFSASRMTQIVTIPANKIRNVVNPSKKMAIKRRLRPVGFDEPIILAPDYKIYKIMRA